MKKTILAIMLALGSIVVVMIFIKIAGYFGMSIDEKDLWNIIVITLLYKECRRDLED